MGQGAWSRVEEESDGRGETPSLCELRSPGEGRMADGFRQWR